MIFHVIKGNFKRQAERAAVPRFLALPRKVARGCGFGLADVSKLLRLLRESVTVVRKDTGQGRAFRFSPCGNRKSSRSSRGPNLGRLAVRNEKGEARVRYVIAVCIVTGFLIWDGAYNNGHYLDMVVRELRHLASLVGA